jgi:cytochrome d ubiquinol oxidase subunit I
MRTVDGVSPNVHSGTALFTLIGFCGLYLVLGLLFLFLIGREIAHGPSHAPHGDLTGQGVSPAFEGQE